MSGRSMSESNISSRGHFGFKKEEEIHLMDVFYSIVPLQVTSLPSVVVFGVILRSRS